MRVNKYSEKTLQTILDYEKLGEVEKEIAQVQAEHNFKAIKEQLEHLVDDTNNLNTIKMWQLKKKLGIEKKEPPTAKRNRNGEIVTNAEKVKELYESTYKERMAHRKIKPELRQMYDLKMHLFHLRLEITKGTKYENWSMESLLKVCRFARAYL